MNLYMYKPEFIKEKSYVTIRFLNNDIKQDYLDVVLVDYSINGIIPVSLLTKKKRIKSINKVAPIDKDLPAIVENFDINKNIVSLSRKYIDKNSDEYQCWVNEVKSKTLIISLVKGSIRKLEKEESYFYENIINPIAKLRFDEESKLNIFDYLKNNFSKLELPDDVKSVVEEFLNMEKPVKTVNYLSEIGLIAKSSFDEYKKQILDVLERYPNLQLKSKSVPYFTILSNSNNSVPNDHHLFVDELNKLENKLFNIQVKELVVKNS